MHFSCCTTAEDLYDGGVEGAAVRRWGGGGRAGGARPLRPRQTAASTRPDHDDEDDDADDDDDDGQPKPERETETDAVTRRRVYNTDT